MFDPIRYAAQTAAFRSYFGLSNAEAAVLASLFFTVRPLTLSDLAQQTGVASHGSITVRVCELRRIMDNESIDYTREGYSLTEIGRAECETACRAMIEALAA